MTDLTIDLEKLRLVMDEVTEEKGPFTLFGLFLREDAPNKWDLVVSAPWLEHGKLKALGEFAEKLAVGVGEQAVMELSRIVTVSQRGPSAVRPTRVQSQRVAPASQASAIQRTERRRRRRQRDNPISP